MNFAFDVPAPSTLLWDRIRWTTGGNKVRNKGFGCTNESDSGKILRIWILLVPFGWSLIPVLDVYNNTMAWWQWQSTIGNGSKIYLPHQWDEQIKHNTKCKRTNEQIEKWMKRERSRRRRNTKKRTEGAKMAEKQSRIRCTPKIIVAEN